MLTAAIDGLVARFGLQNERLGEVAAGAVLKHSRDFNLTASPCSGRASRRRPRPTTSSGVGTGLGTVVLVSNKIALGQIESGVAGGVDTTSDAPIAVNEDLREVLLETGPRRRAAQGARRDAAGSARRPSAEPRAAHRPVDGRAPGDHQPRVGDHPRGAGRAGGGQSPDLAAAYDRGFFDDLLTPFLGLTATRTCGRLDRREAGEALAGVRPRVEATMTAGNSTPLTDGASRCCSHRTSGPPSTTCRCSPTSSMPRRGRRLRARRQDADGLLMAPVYALPRLLARNKLTLQDFDFYEIHEAFASTVLTTLAAWEDDAFCSSTSAWRRARRDRPVKLNVNGSSLAAGHPFAATGGRIVATLAKMLHENGGGRGLISICAAGGQGVVAILEA